MTDFYNFQVRNQTAFGREVPEIDTGRDMYAGNLTDSEEDESGLVSPPPPGGRPILLLGVGAVLLMNGKVREGLISLFLYTIL